MALVGVVVVGWLVFGWYGVVAGVTVVTIVTVTVDIGRCNTLVCLFLCDCVTFFSPERNWARS